MIPIDETEAKWIRVLRVDMLERPCLAPMDAERIALSRIFHSSHRLDVHQ